jgi:signal transduction histidine kinase
MSRIRTWVESLNQKRRELRSQALLWIVLPLTIMLAIIFLVNLYAYQQVVQSLIKARNQELARTAAAGLSQNIQAYADVLQALASTESVSSGNPQHQSQALQLAHGVLQVFDGGVFVLNAQGVVTASDRERPDMIGLNLAIAPYFQNTRALNRPTFSDITLDPGSHEQSIIVAAPISDSDGAFQGMVIGSFRILEQRLGRELRDLGVAQNGAAYLVDRNGRAIFHTDYNQIAQDLSDQDSVDRLKHGDDDGSFLEGQRDHPGFVVSFARVKATGWGLVIREPWGEVIAPIEPYVRFILLALVIGFFLAGALVTLSVSRVTAPMAALVKSTGRVARGDFSIRVQETGIKEIAELGKSFNFMIDQISRYRAGMRRYVAAITHSQEDERKRISRDLHDDTVQALVAVGQRIDLCRAKFGDGEDITADLVEVRHMVTDTVHAVRQFSRDLRPLALEDLGLIPALQYLVNELSVKTNTTLKVEGEAADGLAPELEVAIYRIVQETLQNVRKHADAVNTAVTVTFTEHNVEIAVKDDGHGFTVPENLTELARSGSFGVMGIEERVKLFGGAFHVASEIDKGTRVSVILPREIATDWEFRED